MLQEESLQELRRRWDGPEGKDFLVCPELECPVCLVEMVPPTRIWQCRSPSQSVYWQTHYSDADVGGGGGGGDGGDDGGGDDGGGGDDDGDGDAAASESRSRNMKGFSGINQ